MLSDRLYLECMLENLGQTTLYCSFPGSFFTEVEGKWYMNFNTVAAVIFTLIPMPVRACGSSHITIHRQQFTAASNECPMWSVGWLTFFSPITHLSAKWGQRIREYRKTYVFWGVFSALTCVRPYSHSLICTTTLTTMEMGYADAIRLVTHRVDSVRDYKRAFESVLSFLLCHALPVVFFLLGIFSVNMLNWSICERDDLVEVQLWKWVPRNGERGDKMFYIKKNK